MVCDDKWHSVVRVLFFILDEVFSVNTTCFVKTMVNARIVVTPLFQMIFRRAKTSNAQKNSAAHIQEKHSSYTAMPTARQNILSTS
jgi:hypothetical protein